MRKLAGIEDDELPLAAEVAGALLGREGLVFGHPDAGARLVGHRIIVPREHPDLNFVIAHELGEWALRYLVQFSGSPSQKEAAANYIAGAIIAPPAAVLAAYRCYGERLRPIARAFGASQTSMVVRMGLVLGDSRAVLTANNDHIIAVGAIWGTIPIVDIVRKGMRRPDIVKTKLSGGIDEGRVALRWR